MLLGILGAGAIMVLVAFGCSAYAVYKALKFIED